MRIIERGALRESEYVMVDAVVVLLGLFSASIFLAHAVEMYQAQGARRV
jgi:hypothetical protein